jgi:hypothetical protein
LEYNNGSEIIRLQNKERKSCGNTYIQVEHSSILIAYKEKLKPANNVVHRIKDLDVMTLVMILNAVINDYFEGIVLRKDDLKFTKHLKRTEREIAVQCINHCLVSLDIPRYPILEDKKFKFLKKKDEIFKKYLAAIEKFEVINFKNELDIEIYDTYKSEEGRKERLSELEEISNNIKDVKKDFDYTVKYKTVVTEIDYHVKRRMNKKIKEENETPIYESITPAKPMYNERSTYLTSEQNDYMLRVKAEMYEKHEFFLFSRIKHFVNKTWYKRDKVLLEHQRELEENMSYFDRNKEHRVEKITILPEQQDLIEERKLTDKFYHNRLKGFLDKKKELVKLKYKPNKHRNRWYDSDLVSINKHVKVVFHGNYRFYYRSIGEERIQNNKHLRMLIGKHSKKGKKRYTKDFNKLEEDLDKMIKSFKDADKLVGELSTISIVNRLGLTGRRTKMNLNSCKLALGCVIKDDFLPLLPKRLKKRDKKGDGAKYQISVLEDTGEYRMITTFSQQPIRGYDRFDY